LFNSHRAIAIGSFASIVARGIQTITILIITGIATRSFTKEEFGLWAILLTFLYSGFAFDFGFRSALTNRLTAMVADSSGKADDYQRDFFLSIFYLQIGIGIVGSILSLIFGNVIPWVQILKVQQLDITGYINSLITIVIIILFLNVSLITSSSGFLAFHEVHIDSLLNAIQWLILLGVFWLTNLNKLFSFKDIVIYFFLTYLIIGLIRILILFVLRKWKFIWIPAVVQFDNVKKISSVSMHFFTLNFSAMIVSTGSTFLAGLIGGLKNAGDFSIIQRLFTVLITIHMAFMAAFTPSFTSEARNGNWKGVLNKLNFNLYFTVPLLFIVFGGLIFICHPLILKLWTGLTFENYSLTGLFALYALFMGWGNTNSILLNSLGLVKSQAVWSFVIAPIFLLFTFYFGKTLGVTGIVLASTLSAFPGMIYFTFYTRNAIKKGRINV
jgi:O-antigen/teichoic acid export membrane protein